MGLYRSANSYTPPPTPYGGLVEVTQGSKKRLVPAVTAPHLLVSGVSGSGKSRRVLAPGILSWQGPVVAVSSKPDLIDLTLQHRVEGAGYNRTFVLDLSGEVPDDVLPEGAHKVVIDPTVLIKNDDDALDMATVLIESGTAGASQGQNKGGDAFWSTLATAPLAAILRAASYDRMAWVQRAVGAHEMQPVPDDADEFTAEEIMSKPSWPAAVERLKNTGSHMLAAELESVVALDEKMRDSVGITMKSAVAPWLRSTVMGDEGAVPFVPDLLSHPASTLYVIAPATGVAAGAAVAAVDFISKRWRANQTEKEPLPRILMVVDELCNTLPWPKLPTVVTESRAMGIHLLCAVQGTSQFAKRYGHDGMTELRDVFPAILCLYGAPEKEVFEKAAWWRGQDEVRKESRDAKGHISTTLQKEQGVNPHELLPKSINEGRLFRGSRPGDDPALKNEVGLMVRLVDMSQLVA